MKISQYYDREQIALGYIEKNRLVPLDFTGTMQAYILDPRPCRPVGRPVPVEEETARIRFKGEVERGRYIPREDVELELAGRAVVLESGIRQAVEMNVLDLVHLVGGDPRKSQEFLERFEAMLDAALNEYAGTAEFEVTFNDAEAGDASAARE